ncbi:MAG: hypothetical protein DRP87_10260 [Spirochaetes bacterium]|nr:MAG: hypothetical protein DRP87_10260 [Spirochaetota bacterium]
MLYKLFFSLTLFACPPFRLPAQIAFNTEGFENNLVPIITQLGFGGILGLIVGFTLKKLSKLVAILLGLIFILLQVLAYYGIVTINWTPIARWWESFTESGAHISLWEQLKTILFSNLPAVGGALAGFIIGLKIG